MSTFTFYRGIAIPHDEAGRVTANILSNGLSGSEGHWKYVLPDATDVRARRDTLLAKSQLTQAEIFARTPFNGCCACGSASGAVYYALHHNFSVKCNHPIVIEFRASLEHVCVDGRDFLYGAFQFWDRASDKCREWQSNVLCELFGSAILRYFDAVCRSTDQAYRVAIFDLATFDPEVVEAHYANTKIIAGRYNTRFASAFFVKTPVEASCINRLYVPHPQEVPSPDITLDEFRFIQ
jgi:hypothetical protein